MRRNYPAIHDNPARVPPSISPTRQPRDNPVSPSPASLPAHGARPTGAMAFEPVMPPYNSSDPTATFVGSSCLDFLLIELVPMAYRVTNELEAAAQDPSSSADASQQTGIAPRKLLDEDEERDAVFYRLETLGYRVGQGLVERYRLSSSCCPRP